MRRYGRIALCAGSLALSLPATAQTLRVAVSSPVTSIDPHYHNLAPNISLSTQIFNRLVEQDEHARLIPGLAEFLEAGGSRYMGAQAARCEVPER